MASIVQLKDCAALGESATRTGGPRQRGEHAPFLVDALSSHSYIQGNLETCLYVNAGSLSTPNSFRSRKSLGFYVLDKSLAAFRKKDKKNSLALTSTLQWQNMVGICYCDDINEKFITIDTHILNCDRLSRDHGNSSADKRHLSGHGEEEKERGDDYSMHVCVVASTRGMLHRWEVILRVDPTFMTERLRDKYFTLNKLPNVEIIDVTKMEVMNGCPYVSQLKCHSALTYDANDISSDHHHDNNNNNNNNDHDHDHYNHKEPSCIQHLVIACIEGDSVVIRDADLNPMTRCVPHIDASVNDDDKRLDKKNDHTTTTTSFSFLNLNDEQYDNNNNNNVHTNGNVLRKEEASCLHFVSNSHSRERTRTNLLVSYPSGSLAAWDVSTYLEQQILQGQEMNIDQYQLFYDRCGGDIHSFLPLNEEVLALDKGCGWNIAISNRHGKIRLLSISLPDHQSTSFVAAGTNELVGKKSSVVIKERYSVDFAKDIRYDVVYTANSRLNANPGSDTTWDTSTSKTVSQHHKAGNGNGNDGSKVSTAVVTSFNNVPLEISLTSLPTSNTSSHHGHGSGQSCKGMNSSNKYGLCVLTSSSLVHLSLPDLRFIDSIPTMELIDNNSNINCITSGCSVGQLCNALVMIPTFDNEAKVLMRSLDKMVVQSIDQDSSNMGTDRLDGETMTYANSDGKSSTGSKDGRDVLSLFMSADDLTCVRGENADNEHENNDENGGINSSNTNMSSRIETTSYRSPLMAIHASPSSSPSKANKTSSSSSSSSSSRRASASSHIGKGGKGVSGGGSVVVNQPVTFHSRIKSSGYGQTPTNPLDMMAKRRQQQLKEKEKERRKNTAGPGSGSGNEKPRLRHYPLSCEPIATHQPHNDYTGSAGPITTIQFNSDGTQMGVASGSDTSLSVLKMPLSRFKGDGSVYMSHNAPIVSIQFSHHQYSERNSNDNSLITGNGGKNLVLSSSNDNTVKMWKHGRSDCPIIDFTHEQRNSGSNSGSAVLSTTTSTSLSGSSHNNDRYNGSTKGNSSVRNKPFRVAPIHPSFYYNDKFVGMASQNSVFLYRYRTDDNNGSSTNAGNNHGNNKARVSSSNEVKRLQKLTVPVGSYKCVAKWHIDGSKSLTAFACVNSVLSPLLFTATSNKALCLIDVVHGNISRQIENVHEKGVHTIALPQPTMYAQVNQAESNLFLTSGYDNVIQLWDLRAPTVSMRYTQHVNRREPVGCALSPCLRYFATGSEDKQAKLVDIRTGITLQTYTGHRDVVSDVAFHGIYPQLATCSYDGNIKFYCSNAVEA
jgi:WD40 repeat protein